MRKFLASLSIIALLLGIIPTSGLAAEKPISVVVNEQNMSFSSNEAPFIKRDKLFVPAAKIIDQLGYDVNVSGKTYSIPTGALTIKFTEGKRTFYIGSTPYAMHRAVKVKNGTAYVCEEFFKKAFAIAVKYNVSNRTATFGQAPSQLIITSTTSTVDSGFFNFFLPKFEKRYNVKVVVLKDGTGAALAKADRGEADVVFTHSETSEKPYLDNGTLVNYKRVMFNDFILVGPKNNPAGLVKDEAAKLAFQKIFDAKEKFVSRNDGSGTHTNELARWKSITSGILAADIKKDFDLYKAFPDASGNYIRANAGMGDCLLLANQRGAYCLTDRGTWLNYKTNEGVRDLSILNEGDAVYKNIYHVAMVNPEKFPQVKTTQAKQFIDFILGPEGQAMIRDYKINGEPAFYCYLD